MIKLKLKGLSKNELKKIIRKLELERKGFEKIFKGLNKKEVKDINIEDMIKEVKRALQELSYLKNGQKREDILKRDDYKCRLCGSKTYLQIHHLTPKECGGDDSVFNLITLCKSCHLFMHCNPKLIIKSKQRHINLINAGLVEAKAKGKKLGRPTGSKDKKLRRTSGYANRWLKK